MGTLTKIEGELDWTRVVNPEEYNGKKHWSTTVHPTRDSLDVIRDLQADGIKNVVKKDDRGYYVKFSRPIQQEKKGKIVKTFQPPIVTDKDGNVIDGMKIGNGSKGVVTLDVYEHAIQGGGKAKAARLESIQITELVEYVPQSN